MLEPLERRIERDRNARRFTAGRAIIAAWIVAVLLLLVSAGVEALASRQGVSPRREALIGATIPRYDPTCGRPGIPAPQSSACNQAGTAYEDPGDPGSVPW
jgi:hypothetical protein